MLGMINLGLIPEHLVTEFIHSFDLQFGRKPHVEVKPNVKMGEVHGHRYWPKNQLDMMRVFVNAYRYGSIQERQHESNRRNSEKHSETTQRDGPESLFR